MSNPFDSDVSRRVAIPFRIAARFAEASFEDRYARLLLAMSLQEAKQILGFPANASPTPEEISKAYKRKAIDNHPDRGGDNAKMVEINVAKDLLEGKGKATWQPERAPRPEPPKAKPIVDTVPGQSFDKATSGVPSGVEWKFISKPEYGRTSKNTSSGEIWTLYGHTDTMHIFVAVKFRGENDIMDWDKDGRVHYEPDWQGGVVKVPRSKDLLKIAPASIKAVSTTWNDDTSVKPPKKWVAWEGGKFLTETLIRKVKFGSGGVSLKDILVGTGAVSGGAIPGRKTTVEMITRYSKERKARMLAKHDGNEKKLFNYDYFDFIVRVNGSKEYILKDETIENLKKSGFLIGIYSYQFDDGQVKNLHKLKGGRMGADAAVAVTLLADALTGEPSDLVLALLQAAEEWADHPSVKTAAVRHLVATTSLEEASILLGTSRYDLFRDL